MSDNPSANGNPAGESVAGSGAQAGDWFSSLPTEFQSEGSLQSFKGKGIADFAKSFVEAQKMIGGSIRLPKADASPEERSKFLGDIYGKLGRPGDAKGYKYNLPTLPEEMGGFSEPHMQKFNDLAFNLGLNNDQVQGILNFYGDYAKGMTPNWEQLKSDARAALTKEFGKGADQKVQMAQRVLMTKGGNDAIKFAEATGLGNAPWFIKMLAEFGELSGEKGTVNGDPAGAGGADSITAKIKAMRDDPKSPYNDERHRDHQAAVEEMQSLYKQRASLQPK